MSDTPPTTVAPRGLRHDVTLECKHLATTSCDVRDESCQERLFELARCLSARDGLRPPLRFISEEAARHKRWEHRAQASSARLALAQALHVLGLGKAPASREQPGQASGVGANAYYAPRDRAVFVVDDDATPDAGELAALSVVHEYVHALQDWRGELLAVLNGRESRSFDQELTAWSALEGEATLYEEVVRALLHDRDPQTWLVPRFAARTGGSDAAILRQARPLEASFATFPYTYGAHWVALETEPPVSTHQILGMRHAWPPPNAQRCDDESPPSLAPDYPRRATDTLGAWLVQAYVGRLARDPERARSAARRWRGDWISLYWRAPGTTPSFIWQTCWDSAHTALDMRELFKAQLRESAGHRAWVTNDEHRVTITVRAEELGELATHVGSASQTAAGSEATP